jgi:hypothetical protein
MHNPSYATDLLEGRLSCAYSAHINALFDDPGNVEEGANGLSKIAHEKCKEVFRSVGENEERFIRRMIAPHHGHLRIESPERGKPNTFKLFSRA